MCRAAGCSVRASRLGRNTMEVQGAGYRGLATGGWLQGAAVECGRKITT